MTYIIPVAVFLLVFILVYSVLAKTLILGSNELTHAIASFLIALLFVVVKPAQQYVTLITPWFVIFLVSLFFLLLIGGFAGGKLEFMMNPGFAWTFLALIMITFVISGIQVLAPVLRPYLPGRTAATGAVPFLITLKNVFFYPSVFGTILLLILAMIVTWILVKSK